MPVPLTDMPAVMFVLAPSIIIVVVGVGNAVDLVLSANVLPKPEPLFKLSTT